MRAAASSLLRTPAFLLALAAFSWPAMMGLHEFGHVLGAWVGGGTVERVVWHPLRFSRTDVRPDPRPLLTVWAGPVAGVLIPLLAERFAAWRRWPVAYAFRLFSGFCLVANGAYVGLGLVDPLGDTETMLRHGTPPWVLAVTGTASSVAGLWAWHRASPWLKAPLGPPPTAHLLAVAGLAVGVVTASSLWTLAG